MMEVGSLSLVDPLSLQQRANAIFKFNSAGNINLFEALKNDALADSNNPEDEGEIMLLAMILLQLNGVKLPSSSPMEEAGADSLNKKKRQRTSPEQLAILEQIFQTDKMPNQQTRVHLADQLGMSSRRVQIWFQNKRAKVKRGVSKEGGDESPLSMLRRNSSSSISSSSSPPSPSSPSSPSSVPSDEMPSPQPASPLLVPQFQSCNNTSTIISTALPSVVPNDNNLINASPAPSTLSCDAPSNTTSAPLQFTLSSW